MLPEHRCGLWSYGCIGSHEHEARYRRYLRILTAVLADQDEACTAIGHRQDDGFPRPRPDRLHRDDEKLTDRLVQILKSQLGRGFGGRESKAELLCTRIDFPQRRCRALKAELGDRQSDKLKLRPLGTQGKGRSSQYSAAAFPTPHPIALIALPSAKVSLNVPSWIVFHTETSAAWPTGIADPKAGGTGLTARCLRRTSLPVH